MVAVGAYLLFAYILLPLRIDGRSMEPTYRDGSLNFCYRLSYLFDEPERFDVVAIRFAGSRVVLLKRIVAFAGETVEFRQGRLYIDGAYVDEPYLKYPSDWNMAERTVEPGRVYVVGDNRSVPIKRHKFGQTLTNRILGTVLW